MIYRNVLEGGAAPLARTTSMSSCAGYHTPIEDEVAGDGISDLPSDLGLMTSRGGSFLQGQVKPDSAQTEDHQTLTDFFLGTVPQFSYNDNSLA